MEISEKINHICYEIWMMNEVDLIVDTNDNHYKMILQNALLESFLIHCRSIIDFLFFPPKYKDDISAEYFLTKDDFKYFLKKQNGFIPIIERINKEVAHLTTKRSKDLDKKIWNIKEIKEIMNSEFKEFLEKTTNIEFKEFYKINKNNYFK